jgi:precorrin-6A/cobalt-precorrin-6A reductase
VSARVLLLGGTGDALRIARAFGPDHVYSLAGLGRVPADLRCAVRVGGFGGAEGLARYLDDERIGLVLDATHPYAAQISANAARACERTQVPYWALRRAPWQPQPGDDWRNVKDWAGVIEAIEPYARVLFTLGREPLAHLGEVPLHQHWTVRCLDAHPGHARAQVIDARGPYTPEGERALFETGRYDVVVSKNSGGAATEAKLQVARETGLPVVMMQRPALPPAQREFASVQDVLDAIADLNQRNIDA